MTHPLYPSLTPEMLDAGRERYERSYRRCHDHAFPCWGPSALDGQERLDRWLAHEQRRHAKDMPI